MDSFFMGIDMQTKDIDKIPVLQFLKDQNGRWATLHPGFEHSVCNALPEDLPPKLVHSVMRNLIKKGYVDGCDCGCRGDFVITEKGLNLLEE